MTSDLPDRLVVRPPAFDRWFALAGAAAGFGTTAATQSVPLLILSVFLAVGAWSEWRLAVIADRAGVLVRNHWGRTERLGWGEIATFARADKNVFAVLTSERLVLLVAAGGANGTRASRVVATLGRLEPARREFGVTPPA